MSVPSPCIDVCRFQRDLCIGCMRKKDEIRRWEKMTDVERRRVLSEVKARSKKLQASGGGS